MFATLVRWICAHPYWYTFLSSIPYTLVAALAGTFAVIVSLVWTFIRMAMIPHARKKQAESTKQTTLRSLATGLGVGLNNHQSEHVDQDR